MAKLGQSLILEESFALIAAEFGPHGFNSADYVVQRAIHSTADSECKPLVTFGPGALGAELSHLAAGGPIIVDVTVVPQGVAGLVDRTVQNPLLTAVTPHHHTPTPVSPSSAKGSTPVRG